MLCRVHGLFLSEKNLDDNGFQLSKMDAILVEIKRLAVGEKDYSLA